MVQYVYNHSLLVDAKIMASRNRPIIGEILWDNIGYHSKNMAC